jgi:bifunctional DNA-binding transcriptional regulator/antitoxin component of YhaV-PrlF toxin-antitoxin module
MSYQSHAVAQGLNSRDLMLVLRKQLSPSGVSSLGRIVLPKKEAETHLPQLDASEGVLLTMTDYDTAQNWTFRYRFWSNNKSRMYLLENTRDFVKAHNLQERDILTLYRDAHGSYVVRGEKNNSNQTGDAANDTAAEDIPTEEDLPHKRQKF